MDLKVQNQSQREQRRKCNARDFDDNNSHPSDVSGHEMGSLNEEYQNRDDVKTWDSVNEHFFSVLRLITIGAAYSVLLKFELRNGQRRNGRHVLLALKNKYQNTSHQRRQTLLWQLDNSVMKFDTNPDVFLFEIFQLRDELSGLGETVSTSARQLSS